MKRGTCSLSSKKQKRKRYRQKKKFIHKHGKEQWEVIADERLRQRWRERAQRAFAADLADMQAEKDREEERKACEARQKDAVAFKQAQRIEMADENEDQYIHRCTISQQTEPLLLDEVLVPLCEPFPECSAGVHNAEYREQISAARQERNQALKTARHYRDIAETIQKEKRELQYKLEEEVELVRNFWRNKIIEGASRSGRILRAALLRK